MRLRIRYLVWLLAIAAAGPASAMAQAGRGPEVPLVVADGSILVVLNKSDDTVSLLDPESGEPLATIAVGHAPHEVAITHAGRFAYVANYGDRAAPGKTLSVLDLAKREVVSTIDLGEHRRPHGICLSRDGRTLFVTAEGTKAVLEIDTASERIRRAFPTEQLVSHMCVLAPDEKKLYVANLGSRSVSIANLETGGVSRVETGEGPEGIDISPNGREVWVANRAEGTLVVLDARADTAIARFRAGKFPIRVKFTPDGRHVLVSNAEGNEVAVFDAAKRSAVARIPTGEAPIGILVEPNGKYAWVAQTAADRVSRIDLSTWKISGHVTAGREPDGLGWMGGPAGQEKRPAGR